MTIRVTITKAGRSNVYGQALLVGTTYSLDDAYGRDLIQQGFATDTDSVLSVLPPNDPYLQGNSVRLDGNYTLKASDDQTVFACTTSLTVTVPAGLLPMPSVFILCPASGTLTIASGNSASINGATTSLTRTRALNPIGIAITPNVLTADSYGVSGS